MSPLNAILWVIVILVVLAITYVVVRLIRELRGRRKALVDKYGEMPSHTKLYFEHYFSKLISEWDLVTHPKLERWNKNIKGKLKSIGGDINEIRDYRTTIDKRLDRLEKEVKTLERK